MSCLPVQLIHRSTVKPRIVPFLGSKIQGTIRGYFCLTNWTPFSVLSVLCPARQSSWLGQLLSVSVRISLQNCQSVKCELFQNHIKAVNYFAPAVIGRCRCQLLTSNFRCYYSQPACRPQWPGSVTQIQNCKK